MNAHSVAHTNRPYPRCGQAPPAVAANVRCRRPAAIGDRARAARYPGNCRPSRTSSPAAARSGSASSRYSPPPGMPTRAAPDRRGLRPWRCRQVGARDHRGTRSSGPLPDGQIYIDLCGSTPGVRPRTTFEAIGHALRGARDGPPRRSRVPRRRPLPGYAPTWPGSGPSCCSTTPTTRTSSNGCSPRQAAALSSSPAVRCSRRSTPAFIWNYAASTRVTPPISSSGGPGGAAARLPPNGSPDLCENLPLALRIAAARLASSPDLSMDALADRLADQRTRLDELAVQGLAVRSSIQVSYDDLYASDDPLDQRAAAIFAVIGLLPLTTITAPYAAAVEAGTDTDGARLALDRLTETQTARQDCRRPVRAARSRPAVRLDGPARHCRHDVSSRRGRPGLRVLRQLRDRRAGPVAGGPGAGQEVPADPGGGTARVDEHAGAGERVAGRRTAEHRGDLEYTAERARPVRARRRSSSSTLSG